MPNWSKSSKRGAGRFQYTALKIHPSIWILGLLMPGIDTRELNLLENSYQEFLSSTRRVTELYTSRTILLDVEWKSSIRSLDGSIFCPRVVKNTFQLLSFKGESYMYPS